MQNMSENQTRLVDIFNVKISSPDVAQFLCDFFPQVFAVNSFRWRHLLRQTPSQCLLSSSTTDENED